MIELKNLIDDTIDRIETLSNQSAKAKKYALASGDRFYNLYEKYDNESLLAISIAQDDVAVLYSNIVQLSLLLQMSLRLVSIISRRVEDKTPEKKKQLQREVAKQLKPLLKKYEEHEKSEKEINKKAKDREDKIGDMFG